MATLHVLRVFTSEDGGWGNPLGVFLDGAAVPDDRRQDVARELGYSETVFVEDAESGVCRIFTPASELPFAGHPTVGTAWLLAQEGNPVESLATPAGSVEIRRNGELTHVAARAEWSPPFELIQLPAPEDVQLLPSPPPDAEMTYFWAWEEEAEATGSAAISLCVTLEL